jgi:hypothetical protein
MISIAKVKFSFCEDPFEKRQYALPFLVERTGKMNIVCLFYINCLKIIVENPMMAIDSSHWSGIAPKAFAIVGTGEYVFRKILQCNYNYRLRKYSTKCILNHK